MNVVLDVCAAFEVMFNRKKAELYTELLESADDVFAPEFFLAESANAMWKHIRVGDVTEEESKLNLAFIYQMVTKYEDTGDLVLEALHEANRLNHPAYDMFYLILARRNAATLLTTDEKLASLARELGIEVV